MASRDDVIAALRQVRDPELPVNLYDLGLIYDLEVVEDRVSITMTLTTPNCPVAEQIPEQVRSAVLGVEGVSSVDVRLVWEPPWSSERMSEEARMQLEMMGIQWSDHGPRGPSGTDITDGRKRLY